MTTIEEGSVDGQSLHLTTKDVARMSFANDVEVTKVKVGFVEPCFVLSTFWDLNFLDL